MPKIQQCNTVCRRYCDLCVNTVIEKQLNSDLASISAYLKLNDLVINLKKNKTESMLLGTSKRISTIAPESRKLTLFYNEMVINFTSSYKYLGSVLDQNLNLAENFDKKYKKASSRLGLLPKLKQQLTIEAALAIYNSVIIPVLKYNCIIQLNLNKTQMMKLKSFECRANSILQTNTCVIKNEFEKHAILLVKNV